MVGMDKESMDIRVGDIEDFGIHLSGARKNKIELNDLESLSVREILNRVKKTNVWEEPDWINFYGKYDSKIMYYTRMIRDRFKPNLGIKIVRSEQYVRDRAKEYINIANRISEACVKVWETNDASIIKDTIDDIVFNGVSTDLYNNLIKLREIEKRYTDDACELQNFPENKVGRLKLAYIEEYVVLENGEKKKKYQIVKRLANGAKVSVSSHTFTSRDSAINFSHNNLCKTSLVSKGNRKVSNLVDLVRPELEKVERYGPNIRKNINVRPGEMLSLFNIAGGEFGIWHSQEDRQAVLNYTYDALMDLAYVLELPPQAISLPLKDEKLSLSYGTRGSGYKAKAEYLKDSNGNEILHIQKKQGAGWIARAYGFALLNFVGGMYLCDRKDDISWYYKNFVYDGNSKYNVGILDAYMNLYKIITKTPYSEKLNALGRRVRSNIFVYCFEAYVEDMLDEKGLRNDFLVSYTNYKKHKSSSVNSNYYKLYPEDDSRKSINKAMGEFLDVVLKYLREGYTIANTENINGKEYVNVGKYLTLDGETEVDLGNLGDLKEAIYFDGVQGSFKDILGSKDKRFNKYLFKPYSDLNSYVSYVENIVQQSSVSPIKEDDIKASPLNLGSRLDLMINQSNKVSSANGDYSKCVKALSKLSKDRFNINVVFLNTSKLLIHKNKSFYTSVSGSTKRLYINSGEGIKVSLENLVSGIVDLVIDYSEENVSILDKVIKSTTTALICRRFGLDVYSKYCNDEVIFGIEKNPILTSIVIDETRKSAGKILGIQVA